jgi:hypothetical protein
MGYVGVPLPLGLKWPLISPMYLFALISQGNSTVLTLVEGKRPLAIWDELLDLVLVFLNILLLKELF